MANGEKLMVKKRLRKEIKWFLIGAAATQIAAISLHMYNDYLFSKLAYTNVLIENITLIEAPKAITPTYQEIDVCSTNAAKSYMDYRAITSTTSKQYELIKTLAIVDGHLVDSNDNIAVALGSYWGEIGDQFIFILSNGQELHVVKADEKDDKHVINGCEHKIDGSVLEFIIDSKAFEPSENGYIYNGNFNNVEQFNGEIVRVLKK